MKLVLNDSPDSVDIPHEYDIALVKQVVDNTYVFTEKDMPKFDKQPPKPKPVAAAGPPKPAQKLNRFNYKERFTPYVKTIPSMDPLDSIRFLCNLLTCVQNERLWLALCATNVW